MPSPPQHIAVYPGSFDPITFGHLDVIDRARRLFDHIIVGVGVNPGKVTLFSQDERLTLVRTMVAKLNGSAAPAAAGAPPLAPVTVLHYDGLTIDFAASVGAAALIRGVRNLSDLQYEVQQAVTNREVASIESVFIVAGQSFAYTSSTLIRQIAAMGKDLSILSTMCPPEVIAALQKKKDEGSPVLRALVQ